MFAETCTVHVVLCDLSSPWHACEACCHGTALWAGLGYIINTRQFALPEEVVASWLVPWNVSPCYECNVHKCAVDSIRVCTPQWTLHRRCCNKLHATSDLVALTSCCHDLVCSCPGTSPTIKLSKPLPGHDMLHHCLRTPLFLSGVQMPLFQ